MLFCKSAKGLMQKMLEKIERRLGERLFLKGDRCSGPKCAAVRKSYPPGIHGRKKKRRKSISEFSTMLREKQKIRFLYGLDDRDIKRYAQEAALGEGLFSSLFFAILESRLDNAVFRLGFAPSRRVARQLVNHAHVAVNGRAVTIPSFRVRKGDRIGLTRRFLKSGALEGLNIRLKKYAPPPWLALDREKKDGEVVGVPESRDEEAIFDAAKMKEFYAR
jgi:small subunit ribosomal protein S4